MGGLNARSRGLPSFYTLIQLLGLQCTHCVPGGSVELRERQECVEPERNTGAEHMERQIIKLLLIILSSDMYFINIYTNPAAGISVKVH